MALRDSLRERPSVAVGIAGAVIVVALILIVRSSSTGSSATASDRAFFTSDDGKTWFEDDEAKLPPFDRGGKDAVRAYVYQSGGKKFVNHVERLTLEGKKSAQAAASGAVPAKPSAPRAGPVVPVVLSEVKRPGDADWVPMTDMTKAATILSVRLPPGVTGEATPVEP